MFAVSTTIVAIFLGFFVAFLLKISAGKQLPGLPRGSFGWPLIGETLSFLKAHKSNSIGAYLQQRCSRYGKVFKSHLFGSAAIVSCDQELNMFVLQNDDRLFEVSYPKAMHGILGRYSLILVGGDIHKKLRNIVVSFISSSKSKPSFLNCVDELSVSTMASWKDKTQVLFYSEAKMFALNLMVKHLLSIEPDEPLGFQILEEFETFMKGFVSLPLNLPWTAFAKAVKARGRLSAIVKQIMRQKEREKKGVKKEDDFLDVIMETWRLNDDETVSVVLDILLGGYETTATLMGLIVYFLAHSPMAFAKLKEEHEAVRHGKKDGDALNWEDYKQMEFTTNVIYEALRCGNVVKFVHRKAIQDVKFKDIFIPSGWKVLPIFATVHLDPTLHENPQEFNPWRWTDKEMMRKVSPFGGGPRLCPGAELAKVEIAFFLHHLVLNYRWKTKEGEHPFAYPYVKFPRDLHLHIEPAQRLTTEEAPQTSRLSLKTNVM